MPDEGWTVATLKVHLQRQHDDLIVFLNERSLAQGEAMRTALAAAEKAVSKAEVANEKRFESVNEFRAQLLDQQNTLLTRNEYTAKHDALVARIDAMDKQLSETHGRSTGVRLSAGALIGALSGLGALVTIVVVLVNFTAR